MDEHPLRARFLATPRRATTSSRPSWRSIVTAIFSGCGSKPHPRRQCGRDQFRGRPLLGPALQPHPDGRRDRQGVIKPAELARGYGSRPDRRRHLRLQGAEFPERLPYLRARDRATPERIWRAIRDARQRKWPARGTSISHPLWLAAPLLRASGTPHRVRPSGR